MRLIILDKPSPTGFWCWYCGYPAADGKPGTGCRKCGMATKRTWRATKLVDTAAGCYVEVRPQTGPQAVDLTHPGRG